MTEPTDNRRTMERRLIFSAKAGHAQIGFIEGKAAFDLSGSRRCDYETESGNLIDPVTAKIVGHVSLDGYFVGAAWLSEELFGAPGEAGVDANGLTEAEDGLLDRAMSMIKSVSTDE